MSPPRSRGPDWGWNLSGLGRIGAPKKRTLIVVWSLGGPLRGGIHAHSWAYGRKFSCLDKGRLLITTTQTAATTRVEVRMQASCKVIAVGEHARKGGWIRAAKTCQDEEK